MAGPSICRYSIVTWVEVSTQDIHCGGRYPAIHTTRERGEANDTYITWMTSYCLAGNKALRYTGISNYHGIRIFVVL